MTRRIAIFGNAAGGKSTLARELSMRLGIERHSLDDVQWRAGWQPAPLEEVARHHRAWLERDAWIIDGWGSWDLIEERVRSGASCRHGAGAAGSGRRPAANRAASRCGCCA